jgi:hypothetical protein
MMTPLWRDHARGTGHHVERILVTSIRLLALPQMFAI